MYPLKHKVVLVAQAHMILLPTWPSGNCNLTVNGNFFEKNENFAQFFLKKCQVFDSQTAIFRRVSCQLVMGLSVNPTVPKHKRNSLNHELNIQSGETNKQKSYLKN